MTTLKPDNYTYASSISYADRSKITKGGVREVIDKRNEVQISKDKVFFTEDIRNAWYSSYPLRIGQGYIFYTDKTPHTAWVDYNKQHLCGEYLSHNLEMKTFGQKCLSRNTCFGPVQ